MTTKLNKYRNGKIYIIRSDQSDQIYIGSTVKSLEKRLRKHETDYKAFNNGTYHYVTSFELLKNDNYYIELLERYPCDSEQELRRREGHFHKTVDCVNKYIAGRTRAEYYQNNKETISEKNKQYYQNNKATICENAKQYYQNNKEIICENTKQYYQNNKAKISEQKKQKHICPCGGQFTTAHKARHFKTIKHQQYEQN